MDFDQAITIRMYHPEEASTGNYDVIQISAYEYQMVNNDPFYPDLSYGTVFEVKKEPYEAGILEFNRISKASDFSLEVYGLPQVLNEKELSLIGDLIVKAGGFWEVIFGGMGYLGQPLKRLA